MQVGALGPYEHSLRAAAPLALVDADGRTVELDVARWLAPVDDVDRTVIGRCTGQVLDIGCGPGRFVRALAERGVPALGVDIAETAVSFALRLGVPALLRNVFDHLPGEGRWPTVLLMDGNVGIGGDVNRLLQRVHAVLAPSGKLIVEVEAHDVDESMTVWFSQDGEPTGASFRWTRLGLPALRVHAERAGYSVTDTWSAGGRVFAELVRSRRTRSA